MKDPEFYAVTWNDGYWWVYKPKQFGGPIIDRYKTKEPAVKKGRKAAKGAGVPAILKIENKEGIEIERNSYNF